MELTYSIHRGLTAIHRIIQYSQHFKLRYAARRTRVGLKSPTEHAHKNAIDFDLTYFIMINTTYQYHMTICTDTLYRGLKTIIELTSEKQIKQINNLLFRMDL